MATNGNDGWKSVLAAALENIPIIGKILKAMFAINPALTLRVAAFAFVFLVVYPLLLPFIAALLINKGVLFDLQEPYASKVRAAFRVKEAADIANRDLYSRLDYFQMIAFVGNGRDSKIFELPVDPWQRVVLQIEGGGVHSTGDCAVPLALSGRGADLYSVRLGELKEEFTAVRTQDRADEVSISTEEWHKLVGRGQAGRLKLTFMPVTELKSSACGDKLEVEVQLAVKVFKDLIPRPVDRAASQAIQG